MRSKKVKANRLADLSELCGTEMRIGLLMTEGRRVLFELLTRGKCESAREAALLQAAQSVFEGSCCLTHEGPNVGRNRRPLNGAAQLRNDFGRELAPV